MATLKELNAQAAELNISGRSKLNKAQLETAINEALAAQRAAEAADHAWVTAHSTEIPATEPLSAAIREMHYRSGAQGGMNLTAKQQRRLNKKLAKHGR